MTAYELAAALSVESSQMEYGYVVSDWELLDKSANMLRQQADRIAELEELLKIDGDEIKILQSLLKEKQSEPVAWIRSGDDQLSLVKEKDDGYMVWKPLYLAPQTKPLSFDAMVELGKEVAAVWDVNINGSVWFPSVDAFESFCRAIEERHGIK